LRAPVSARSIPVALLSEIRAAQEELGRGSTGAASLPPHKLAFADIQRRDFAQTLGKSIKAAEPRGTAPTRPREKYKTRLRMPRSLIHIWAIIEGWLATEPQLDSALRSVEKAAQRDARSVRAKAAFDRAACS